MIENTADLSDALEIMVPSNANFGTAEALALAHTLVEHGVTFTPRPRANRKIFVGAVLTTQEEVINLIEPFDSSNARILANTVISDTTGQVFVLIDDDSIPWRGMSDGWCNSSSFKYPVTVLQVKGENSV